MESNDAEKVLLESLDRRLQYIRDRVQGVAEGYSTGLYLWGGGGTSKSHTVQQTLKDLKKEFKLTNSRVTAKGLFLLLQEFPDCVHVIEDAETMLRDEATMGVLRSALWGQVGRDGKQERIVTWQTAKKSEEFAFAGGVVIISNCELANSPQVQAFKGRITSVHYQPTNAEVAAKMRAIARQGYAFESHILTSQECMEVVQEIINRSERIHRNLDLRLFINALHDRLQWENGAAETHWHDLLESRMQEKAMGSNGGIGVRATKKADELALLRRNAELSTTERLVIWKNETKKSPAAFYRRLAELQAENSRLRQELRVSDDWKTDRRF